MWAGSLHLSSALRRIWPMLSVCLNRTPYPSQVNYCKPRSRGRGITHFQPSLVHSVVWLGLGNVASNCNKRRYHSTTGKQTRNAQLTQPFGSDLLRLWSLPMAPEPPPSCTFLQLHLQALASPNNSPSPQHGVGKTLGATLHCASVQMIDAPSHRPLFSS